MAMGPKTESVKIQRIRVWTLITTFCYFIGPNSELYGRYLDGNLYTKIQFQRRRVS